MKKRSQPQRAKAKGIDARLADDRSSRVKKMRDRFSQSLNYVAEKFFRALFVLICFASIAQTSFAQRKGIREGVVDGGNNLSQGRVAQGEAIKRVEPLYPFWARFLGIKGAAVVEITIDEKGDVINARAMSGRKMFRKAAIDAAMQWKFNPTLLDGKPVKVISAITMYFPAQKDREEKKPNQADEVPSRLR
jgi:TonB family protein